jgi:DNA-binding CsgD family transcriptional regulator
LTELYWNNRAKRDGSSSRIGFVDTIASVADVLAEGTLTSREVETITMILRGHFSLSIAKNLGIVEGTVKIHRKNIYRKMEISGQALREVPADPRDNQGLVGQLAKRSFWGVLRFQVLIEMIVPAVHFQDLYMVDETVQHSPGQAFQVIISMDRKSVGMVSFLAI